MSSDSFKFGLEDAKIAVWNSAASWGTAQDVEAIGQMTVTVQTISGTLEGDDKIADVYSKLISAQVSMRFGFKSLAVYAILTGQTHESSSNDDAMSFNPQAFPYFAIAGKVDDSDATGNDVLFIPKCKITDGFDVGMQYGQYVTPQITAMAIDNGSPYGVLRLLQHAAATAIAIPPTAIPSA